VPTVCSSIKNLKNPSGVYLKTACLVPVIRTYDNFLIFCNTNQMELFIVDSEETQTAISALGDSQYGSGWLWINGKVGTMCSVLKRTSVISSFLPTTSDCKNLFYGYCGYKSK
jgi:hypothetical protein